MIHPFSFFQTKQRTLRSGALLGLLAQFTLTPLAQAEGQWVQQSFATSPVVSSEDEDVLTGEAALQQLKQDGSYGSLAEL